MRKKISSIFISVYRKSIRFVKFSFVGIINTGVSLICYYGLIMLNVNVQVANFFAFIAGTGNGYLWNKFWVFKGKEARRQEFLVIKFFGVYMISWMISAIFLFVWIEKIGISKAVAPLINVLIMTPINYLLSKYLVFKGGS